MALLCFVLDLRTLSPPLLRDLKQSLLQLANYYAVSARGGVKSKSKGLRDLIGLCYVIRNRISCASELKVAYNPRGNFSLRDFHHAVNNLPDDAFSPEFDDSGVLSCDDTQLQSVLSDKILYSWRGHDRDVARKVIFVSSCLAETLDSSTRKTLMEAAENCVSVDFVLLEQISTHFSDLPENVNNFAKNICDLENCSFRSYIPDAKVFCALVKRWLQDLKDETDEQLQARFVFSGNFLGPLNQILCNLCASFNQIIDEFIPCQTCRCHGFPLDSGHGKNKKSSICPLTGNDLGTHDLVENSVKVGEQTVLFLPSLHQNIKLQHVSSPIYFNVIERTNLGSLSVGLILGASYIVTPSNCADSDDTDKSETNIQFFQGLCSKLHSLDQGLVCTSNSNLETMRETSFQCYYVLLPSDKGLMLLRRLVGSEEVMPFPDASQFIGSTVAKDTDDTVEKVLLKMEVRDYNPVLHERGFHQKLNLLVKESLQFGSIPPKLEELPELSSTREAFKKDSEPSEKATDVVMQEEMPQLNPESGHDKLTDRIAEEWEQLIISEIPKITSSICISKPKLDQLFLSQPETNCKQLDEKTSRILERLEVPRQLKTKVTSPTISSSANTMKKPLIPFAPTHTPDGLISSQPMKPNFQRSKRKQK